MLTLVFPPDLVDEVIAAAGRTEQRHRSLPARVMAYFAIGMGLYSEGSYEDVALSQLTDELSWASGWAESYTPPSPVDLPGPGTVGVEAVGGVVRPGLQAGRDSGDVRGVAGGASVGGDRRQLPGRGRYAGQRGAVLQEIWGHPCCPFAIRSLLADAAQHFGNDPDRELRHRARRSPASPWRTRSAFPP